MKEKKHFSVRFVVIGLIKLVTGTGIPKWKMKRELNRILVPYGNQVLILIHIKLLPMYIEEIIRILSVLEDPELHRC